MPTGSMDIKKAAAIFFDFGETLATLVPSKEELFVRAAGSIGLELDLDAVRRAYQVVDFHNKYSSVHVKDREAFYRNYNEQLAEALGISSHIMKLGPALTSHFRDEKRWQLFDEVPEVLHRLRRTGLPLAVVANWDANLPSLIEDLGIRHLFSAIVASAAVGVEKPDSAIFLAATEKLGVSPGKQTIFYVGNEYRADVLGSRAVGLTPVLIDRGGWLPHADCLRFTSLQDWIKAME